MQQIFRRTRMPKCDFNKVEKQLIEFFKNSSFLQPKNFKKYYLSATVLQRKRQKLLLFVDNNPDSSAVAESIVILQVSLVI